MNFQNVYFHWWPIVQWKYGSQVHVPSIFLWYLQVWRVSVMRELNGWMHCLLSDFLWTRHGVTTTLEMNDMGRCRKQNGCLGKPSLKKSHKTADFFRTGRHDICQKIYTTRVFGAKILPEKARTSRQKLICEKTAKMLQNWVTQNVQMFGEIHNMGKYLHHIYTYCVNI